MNTRATALAVIGILTAATFSRADEAAAPSPFKDEKEKASYAIGVQWGAGVLKRQDIDVNMDAIVRGLKDGYSGENRLLNDDEVRSTLMKFQQEIAAKQNEKRQQAAEKNKKEGEEFLAANKNKPGVITTASGLQYKILSEGSGEPPKPEDTVTVNYRGTLIDGTEFDSSKDNPATLRVNGVVRGWTEALTMMKPGAKWQLFVPSDLAYGDFGRPPKIGPGATLIFDIELVSVQPAPQRAPLTSDIIKVPSLEEMKKGAKIETIKAEELEKLQKEEMEKQKQTNK